MRETVKEFLFRLVERTRYSRGDYTRTDAEADAYKLMEELNVLHSTPITIDARTIHDVNEVARRLLNDARCPVDRNHILLCALHDYMLEQGRLPNFRMVRE